MWIKTQPLKQWEVAREYRRRVKIAFDEAGISIPVPQQSIWLNEIQSLPSRLGSRD
nr:mechanosensitive ion channel family protein [Mastigocoleus testarum]